MSSLLNTHTLWPLRPLLATLAALLFEKIEDAYLEAFDLIKIPNEVIEYTKEALLGSHQEEKNYRESQVSLLTERYKKLDTYIDKLYVDKLEEVIELSFWESRTAAYKAEQEEILSKIDALKSSNTTYMLEGIRLLVKLLSYSH